MRIMLKKDMQQGVIEIIVKQTDRELLEGDTNRQAFVTEADLTGEGDGANNGAGRVPDSPHLHHHNPPGNNCRNPHKYSRGEDSESHLYYSIYTCSYNIEGAHRIEG